MTDANALDQLINLLLSPLGFGLVAVCIAAFLMAHKVRWIKWVLVALLIYFASLQKYRDEWIGEGPPFTAPFETVIHNGRPLTVLLLAVLVILALLSTARSRGLLAPPVVWLLLAQSAICLKLLSYGDLSFAMLTLAVITLTSVLMVSGVRNWIQSEQDIDWCIAAIAGAGALFIVITGLQGFINSSPNFAVHGRLNGTTGNPQHAAALIGATAPAMLFMVLRESLFRRIIWLGLLVAAAACVFLTGSRTGLAMFALSLALVAWAAGLARISVLVVVVGMVVLVALLGTDIEIDDQLAGRFSSTEDTRSWVWEAMWLKFLENPAFGAEYNSYRLGFGENSWLAIAATTGLVGLVPLLIFGMTSIGMMYRLRLCLRVPDVRLRASVVVGGTSSLLAGSVFEAYLLGSLAAPSFLVMLYVTLGYRVIDARRRAERSPAGARRTVARVVAP